MAKVLMVTGAGGTSTVLKDTTRYFCCGNVPPIAETTRAYTQITYHAAGTFSSMGIYISFNNTNSATVNLEKNGSTAGMNLTIPIGLDATGWFEDVTHTDTISDGDEINYAVNPVGGAVQLVFRHIDIAFGATTDTMIRHAAVGFPDLSDGATTYYGLSDRAIVGATTEAPAAFDTNIAATFKNLFVYLSTAPGSGTVVNLRQNGISVISLNVGSVTGIVEETATSVTTSANDNMNYSVDSVNAGALVLEIVSIEEYSTTAYYHSIYGAAGQSMGNVGFGQTTFYAFGGGSAANTTEAWMQSPLRHRGVISNLTVYVASNTIT